MYGRLAAPQGVVIHRRQVVMNQRIRVNHLYRSGGPIERIKRRFNHGASGEHQQRAHALAPTQHGIAHGVVQARRRGCGGRQQRIEHRLHPRMHILHPGGKVELPILLSAAAHTEHRQRRADRVHSPCSRLSGFNTPSSSIFTCCPAALSLACAAFTRSTPR